ncbi:unnamed protein product [Amoebophrya sp. A25]|nr:unnamed protein product [Amoebophrya sp. A25]|eukprot:GSA25T00008999001.1
MSNHVDSSLSNIFIPTTQLPLLVKKPLTSQECMHPSRPTCDCPFTLPIVPNGKTPVCEILQDGGKCPLVCEDGYQALGHYICSKGAIQKPLPECIESASLVDYAGIPAFRQTLTFQLAETADPVKWRTGLQGSLPSVIADMVGVPLADVTSDSIDVGDKSYRLRTRRELRNEDGTRSLGTSSEELELEVLVEVKTGREAERILTEQQRGGGERTRARSASPSNTMTRSATSPFDVQDHDLEHENEDPSRRIEEATESRSSSSKAPVLEQRHLLRQRATAVSNTGEEAEGKQSSASRRRLANATPFVVVYSVRVRDSGRSVAIEFHLSSIASNPNRAFTTNLATALQSYGIPSAVADLAVGFYVTNPTSVFVYEIGTTTTTTTTTSTTTTTTTPLPTTAAPPEDTSLITGLIGAGSALGVILLIALIYYGYMRRQVYHAKIASEEAERQRIADMETVHRKEGRVVTKRFGEVPGMDLPNLPDREYEDGSAYFGQLNPKELKHGVGVLKLKASTYRGQFILDEFSGLGIMAWQAGVVYAGEWKKNQMSGWGTLRVPRKYIYKGQMKKNERHGYGRCEWFNGEYYEGMWQDGKMHGPGKYGTLRVAAIWNWNEGRMGTLLHKLPSGIGGPIQLVLLERPKRVHELQASYKAVSMLLQRYHVSSEVALTARDSTGDSTARTGGYVSARKPLALENVGNASSRHRSMTPRSRGGRKVLNKAALGGVRQAHSVSPSTREMVRSATGKNDVLAQYSFRTDSGQPSARPLLAEHYSRQVDTARSSPRMVAAQSPHLDESARKTPKRKELVEPPKVNVKKARKGAAKYASDDEQQGADVPPEMSSPKGGRAGAGQSVADGHPDPPPLLQYLPMERYEQTHPLNCIHNVGQQAVKFDLDLEAEIDFPQWGFRVGNPFVWRGAALKDCLLITEIYGGREGDAGPLKDWNRLEAGEDLAFQGGRSPRATRVIMDSPGRGGPMGASSRGHHLPRQQPDSSSKVRPIKKFARIVSVNGVTKDLVRMLKVMSMATRDLKLGIVNSAFVKVYEQGEQLEDGTDAVLPYAPHEGPLNKATESAKRAKKNQKTLEAYSQPTARDLEAAARRGRPIPGETGGAGDPDTAQIEDLEAMNVRGVRGEEV